MNSLAVNCIKNIEFTDEENKRLAEHFITRVYPEYNKLDLCVDIKISLINNMSPNKKASKCELCNEIIFSGSYIEYKHSNIIICIGCRNRWLNCFTLICQPCFAVSGWRCLRPCKKHVQLSKEELITFFKNEMRLGYST